MKLHLQKHHNSIVIYYIYIIYLYLSMCIIRLNQSEESVPEETLAGFLTLVAPPRRTCLLERGEVVVIIGITIIIIATSEVLLEPKVFAMPSRKTSVIVALVASSRTREEEEIEEEGTEIVTDLAEESSPPPVTILVTPSNEENATEAARVGSPTMEEMGVKEDRDSEEMIVEVEEEEGGEVYATPGRRALAIEGLGADSSIAIKYVKLVLVTQF
jgi:hypothetical protein